MMQPNRFAFAYHDLPALRPLVCVRRNDWLGAVRRAGHV